MSDLSNVIRILPTMKSGKELLSALEVLPKYDEGICDADAPVRLMAPSDLYRIYVPNQMSVIEYIAEGEHHTMKTRTPATDVLVNIILFAFFTRDRAISRCLLLESLKRLIAVRFALRTGVDYCMYQAQLVRTLGTWRVHVMNQLFQLQG